MVSALKSQSVINVDSINTSQSLHYFLVQHISKIFRSIIDQLTLFLAVDNRLWLLSVLIYEVINIVDISNSTEYLELLELIIDEILHCQVMIEMTSLFISIFTHRIISHLLQYSITNIWSFDLSIHFKSIFISILFE